MTSFNYINCLKPLLRTLGWQGASRRLFEAVPHDVTEIDLVDLKNIFVNLGYTCYSKTVKLSKLSRSFLPTLFINEAKGVFWVIYERTEKDFLYIDCRNGEKAAILVTKKLKGVRYNFIKDLHPDVSLKSWVHRLFDRLTADLWQPVFMALLGGLGTLTVPLFVQFMYDKVMLTQSEKIVPYCVGGLGLIFLSMALFAHIKNRYLSYLVARLTVLVNNNIDRQLLLLSPSQVKEGSIGDHMLKLRQLDQGRLMIPASLIGVLIELPAIILAMIIMAMIGQKLVIIPLLAMGLLLTLVKVYYGRLNSLTAKAVAAHKISSNFMNETQLNLETLRNLAAGYVWSERSRAHLSDAVVQDRALSDKIAQLSTWSLSILKGAGVFTICWGIQQIKQGDLTVGALMAVSVLMGQIFWSLYSLVGQVHSLPLLHETVSKINQLMSESVEGMPALQSIIKPQGHLSVDDVYCRYSEQSKMALQGVHMEAKPGEIIAIIGQNASGKSTFVRLLMQLQQPLSGEIKLDGVNINTLDPMTYRKLIGYAPSVPQFFVGTIAQNMRLAQPEATDKEILQAFEQIGLMEEIQKLPHGIHTGLSEQYQQTYSAGFLQKLNLARALIRDSNILIFDEPAGNIDFKSDAIFKNTIQNLKGKKTVIIVTHRPSIINLADRILVLNQGIMRLFGPREQILNILAGNAA
ncbi:MAG: ATP-binding cassette domain-containing protein [Candidatus Paracaedibacteraceae bacterium]|nr:ATP-binding cassette domain-containing protein [Candidatus Paracaedibacteraceae bacterium]